MSHVGGSKLGPKNNPVGSELLPSLNLCTRKCRIQEQVRMFTLNKQKVSDALLATSGSSCFHVKDERGEIIPFGGSVYIGMDIGLNVL